MSATESSLLYDRHLMKHNGKLLRLVRRLVRAHAINSANDSMAVVNFTIAIENYIMQRLRRLNECCTSEGSWTKRLDRLRGLTTGQLLNQVTIIERVYPGLQTAYGTTCRTYSRSGSNVTVPPIAYFLQTFLKLAAGDPDIMTRKIFSFKPSEKRLLVDRIVRLFMMGLQQDDVKHSHIRDEYTTLTKQLIDSESVMPNDSVSCHPRNRTRVIDNVDPLVSSHDPPSTVSLLSPSSAHALPTVASTSHTTASVTPPLRPTSITHPTTPISIRCPILWSSAPTISL